MLGLKPLYGADLPFEPANDKYLSLWWRFKVQAGMIELAMAESVHTL